jgi:hypothetical protein
LLFPIRPKPLSAPLTNNVNLRAVREHVRFIIKKLKV